MKMLPFFQSGPIGIRNGTAGCSDVNGQLENPLASVAEHIPACPSGDEIWSKDQEKMSERPEAACRTSRASSITSNGSCASTGESPEKGKKGIKGILTTALKKMRKAKPPSSKCSARSSAHVCTAPFPMPSFEINQLYLQKLLQLSYH